MNESNPPAGPAPEQGPDVPEIQIDTRGSSDTPVRDKSEPKKRRRWRLQFSLRSLMLLTLIAALFSAWFFRPRFVDEPIAGGALIAQVQRKQTIPGANATLAGDPEPGVLHGRWRLVDRDGRLLVEGSYRDGAPVGIWTFYDTEGNVVVEGPCTDGLRDGVWTAYAAEETPISQTPFEPREHREPWSKELKTSASRHGPGRLWYDDGTLRAEGQWKDDHRDGQWTFYDPKGSKTAQGSYREGNRHGWWTFWDEPDAAPRRVWHVDGRAVPQLATLLPELRKDVDSDDFRKRYNAVAGLSRLGTEAMPALVEALESDHSDVVRLALAAIGQLGPEAGDAVEHVNRLTGADDRHVRIAALAASLRIDPARRVETLERLFEAAVEGGRSIDSHTALILADFPPESIPLLSSRLADEDPAVRLAVLIVYRNIRGQLPNAPNANSTDEDRSDAQKFADEIDGLVAPLVDDPDERVRNAARSVLDPALRIPRGQRPFISYNWIPVVG